MNQKQRDLLCKMVEAEAARTSTLLNERFLLTGSHGRCVTSRYTDFRIADDKLGGVPANLREQHAALKRQQQKRDIEKKKLDKAWDAWCGNIEICAQQEMAKKNAAKMKLIGALRDAVIDIQFAENATEAKSIINSLPTVAQIMGKL